MQENEFAKLKQKSVRGAAVLTSRTFIMQVIGAVGTFILSIIFLPAIFGVFYIVTAIVNFLNYFSDIGLAAALIQKKDEPTRIDLTTTFTLQQVLVGTVVFVTLLVSGKVANFYHGNKRWKKYSVILTTMEHRLTQI